MKSAKQIEMELTKELEEGNDIEITEFDYLTEDENLYAIIQYDRDTETDFYVRKYGEKFGFWVAYSDNDTCIEELLIGLAIENHNLKKKIKNARRAMR